MSFPSLSFAVSISAAALSLALAPALHAEPAPASAESVLQEMGRLNGLALACQQPVISLRLRDAVVAHSARDRASGEVFEQTTSAAFLQQGKTPVTCPDGRQLAAQADALAQRLQNLSLR